MSDGGSAGAPTAGAAGVAAAPPRFGSGSELRLLGSPSWLSNGMDDVGMLGTVPTMLFIGADTGACVPSGEEAGIAPGYVPVDAGVAVMGCSIVDAL